MDWLDLLLIFIRVLVVFVMLLLGVTILVWVERKVIADMQTRPGPMRAGPRGVLISLADGMKLFFKEGIRPADADTRVYVLAPTIALMPSFLAFAVIPFGAPIEIAGRTVPLQLTNLNVGVLWVLAMSSLAVYGVVLAGWSSGSRYPLIGSIRASAQMISYEVGLSLSLVAVTLYAGTLNLNEIVAKQDGSVWNVIPQFPAFVVFLIAGLAETNRPPFDLPEAESELVAGYHTEYSGIKFAMFYLAEYVHTITISAVAVTLFLGGWSGPAPDFLPWLWPLVWFFAKLGVVIYFYIWIRATLPRVRYDRLMHFGWKILIPFGLVWVLLTGGAIVLRDQAGMRGALIGLAAAAAVVLIATLLWPVRSKDEPPRLREEAGS